MKTTSLMLAAASTFVLASVTTTARAAQPAATTDEATLGEIVVTARRRTESLQEVPQVVNAITSDTIQKLNIREFRDIQSIVPGLTIGATSAQTTLRGVSFNSNTSAQPTIAFYLNETPVQGNHLFQVLFDVGQVEVLRGPQGTSRGIPAPSGAITVTTRRPDLGQFGGYIDAQANDLQRRSVNGAINIPIVRDVLGLRIAGMIDQNDADGVNSIYSLIKPRQVNTAVRTSLSYEPGEFLNANVSWIHYDRAEKSFNPVTGPGSPGATPPIRLKDRVSVQDTPDDVHIHLDAVTAQLDSRLFGQHLQYIGGYSFQHIISNTDRDTGQLLRGVSPPNVIVTSLENTSHEFRISSDPGPDRLFDYVVGVYYGWQAMKPEGRSFNAAIYLPPAFGPLNAPNLALFNHNINLPQIIPTQSTLQDTSIFGSVTLHLGDKTELTGGLRHLWTQSTSELKVFLGDAATPVPVPCNLVGLQPAATPGFCIPRIVAQPSQRRFHEEHTIYNASLKHSFTPDLMVYASVGTSYRPPTASISTVQNASNDPVLNSFLIHPSEKSRSFEVGVKWTFLEGRARVNAAVFKQKFKDMPTFVTGIPFINDNGIQRTVNSTNFVADPDATIEGFDLDAALQITQNWNVSGQLSYADGRATTELPCNDSNLDGIPDGGLVTRLDQFRPGTSVSLCPGGSVSEQPYWNASVQSEYTHPVRDGVDGYVRGLFTYYPKNARQTRAMVIDDYSLLNLYAGLRAQDGAWDFGLYVRNALKTEQLTNLGLNPIGNLSGPLSFYRSLIRPTGYVSKTLTPRREVGVTMRYAFGSR